MQVLRLAQSWGQTLKRAVGGAAPTVPSGKTQVPDTLAPPIFRPDTFERGSSVQALGVIRSDAERMMAGLPVVGASATAPAAPAAAPFTLPGFEELLKELASPAPQAPPPELPEEAPQPVPQPATYTVVSGDSLSGIAGRVLGDGNRWGEIFELNRDQISNPNLIQTGMVLKLPSGAQAAPVAPGPASFPAGQAPYINQYHPAGEGDGYTNGGANCGPTSAAMIARAFGYGQDMSDAKLINHLGSVGGTSGAGTNVNGIAAMARAMGKEGTVKGPRADVGWIAEQLRNGKMIVANGDYYAMPPHNAANIGQGGHYVAVVGIDGDGNFLVHDPADRGIQGKAFTPDQLARFINANTNGGWQIAIG